MDVGQFIPIGEAVLDRYTTLQYGMRWFGYTFTEKFWAHLAWQQPDCDYEEGSIPLKPGEEYSGFLSYRGGSGRWAIQASLCASFNIMPAFYFMVVFCPLVAIGLSFIPDICDSSNKDTWRWLVWANGCDSYPSQRMWFIFRSYARAIVVLMILFWHPVFSRFYRGQRFFIDKSQKKSEDISGSERDVCCDY